MDCAATARTPPGRANLTSVVSEWAIRMNSSFIGDHITSPPLAFKTARRRAGVSVLQFAYFRLKDKRKAGQTRGRSVTTTS